MVIFKKFRKTNTKETPHKINTKIKARVGPLRNITCYDSTRRPTPCVEAAAAPLTLGVEAAAAPAFRAPGFYLKNSRL